jgi:hypothetical protein
VAQSNRFDILVEKTVLMELAQRSRQADRKAKEPAYFDRSSQEPIDCWNGMLRQELSKE